MKEREGSAVNKDRSRQGRNIAGAMEIRIVNPTRPMGGGRMK
jgi:hypothetical protein